MVLSDERMKGHCIRQTDVPHSTRLFTDFLYDFERARDFYKLSPFDDESFRRAAAALSYTAETRAAVAAVLEEQAAAHGAGAATRRNVDRLRRGAAAVVTGHQVGLLTGPVLGFYKALTAVRLAATLTERGLDCIPVFWLATEDHDLEEINHAFVLDGDDQLHRLTAAGASHVEHASVGEIKLGSGIVHTLDQVAASLPKTEWTGELVATLRETYRPDETFGSAFGKLIAKLMDRFGLVLIDPLHPTLRALAVGQFRRTIEMSDELVTALLQRNQELLKAGYHAQVHVTENATLFFQRIQGQRVALKRKNGEFLRGDDTVSKRELLDQLDRCPDDFSSNVLLRPVIQDTLLPTVAYVSGPAELAYFGQAAVLYDRLLGRMPVVYPRANFTLVDSRARELMSSYGVTLQDIFAGPEALREQMAQKFLPANLAETFANNERQLDALTRELHQRMLGFDRTLADAVDTSARKMSYQLGKIKRKAALAAGRRSGVMESDAAVLENLLYPDKTLQERVHSGISLLARYGPDLLDRLYEHTPLHCPDHQVLEV